MYHFYATTKEVFSPTMSSISGLMDEDGFTVLNDPQDILRRWKTHFEDLLNDHSTTPEELFRRTTQHPILDWMSEPPTFQDLSRTIKLIKPGKTPWPDNIPVELLTHGRQEVKTRLMNLLLRIWESKTVPGNLKNANIVTIFKKGTV
ncbi:uncharacterized protein LOC143023491 [Oratosquilla oratoria]|uniref:uncharacterized protein LOC143023491 n=1 Tax=Oratosquilla oratoria TaxID=337810 RepID=UPI003F75964A